MSRPINNSFVKQAAILAAASLFVRFIGFLYRIPLTNMVGDTGFAYYFAAYSVYTFAIAISSGTLPAAVSRLISQRIARGQAYNAHSLFKTAMFFAICIGSGVGLVMFIAAPQLAALVGAPAAASAVRSLAPTVLPVAMLAVFRGYFQGMKNAMPTASSQVVEQVFKVIFTIWLTSIFFDAANIQPAVTGATTGTGIAAVAGLAVVIFIYQKHRPAIIRQALRDRRQTANPRHLKLEHPKRQLRAIITTAIPMVASMVIFSTHNLLDLRMPIYRMAASGAFTPDQARELVGQYSGKFLLLTTLPISLSLALSSAVIPEITSSQVKMDKAALRHKTNLAIRLSMILAIPAAVGLAVLAYPIIALLFPNHPGGGWLLQYGSVAIVFISLVHVLSGTLQGLGLVRLPVISAIIGTIIKAIINHFIIPIPSINILGAVISTIACFMVAAAINLYFLHRHTGILPNLSAAFIKPTIAAAAMGMATYVSHQLLLDFLPSALATLLALAAGAASYLAFMLLIKGFLPSDWKRLPIPGKIKRVLMRM